VPAIPNLKQEAQLWGNPDLSQAAYCRELCPQSFNYHKRKYSTGLVPIKHTPSGFDSVQRLPEQHIMIHSPYNLSMAFVLYLSRQAT
jgi:hypothetical protein